MTLYKTTEGETMLSTQISDIRDFMSKLLSGDCFDRFYLVEAGIRMGITYYLDGHLNHGFYDSDEKPERAYCFWKEARPYIFQIIRGKRQPLRLKIILAFPEKTVEWFLKESGSPIGPEDIEGIYLNILFESGSLLITTGISCRVFSTDKRLEHCVDDHVRSFLSAKGIS